MLILKTQYTKAFISALLSCTLMMLAACNRFPSEDIKFESMVAPDFNAYEYKTFAWVTAATAINDPHGYWQPSELDAEAEIVLSLNKGLRARGFIEVTDKPDFVVLYATGINNMQGLEFNTASHSGKEVVSTIPKAALSVVLIDVKTELPIWLGSAQANLYKDISIEVAKKRIHYAVEEMLTTLPNTDTSTD